VSESRVLRRIFGLKKGEVTGAWRKLHNKELHDLYSSPSVIRMIKLRKNSCECDNEPFGSLKCWETIEWLHNWCPLE
jgi:hypothetical protein